MRAGQDCRICRAEGFRRSLWALTRGRGARGVPLTFRLRFRQGSFRREFHCATLEGAIVRAGGLLHAEGCSEFEIRDAENRLVLDHEQIWRHVEHPCRSSDRNDVSRSAQ